MSWTVDSNNEFKFCPIKVGYKHQIQYKVLNEFFSSLFQGFDFWSQAVYLCVYDGCLWLQVLYKVTVIDEDLQCYQEGNIVGNSMRYNVDLCVCVSL